MMLGLALLMPHGGLLKLFLKFSGPESEQPNPKPQTLQILHPKLVKNSKKPRTQEPQLNLNNNSGRFRRCIPGAAATMAGWDSVVEPWEPEQWLMYNEYNNKKDSNNSNSNSRSNHNHNKSSNNSNNNNRSNNNDNSIIIQRIIVEVAL